MSGKGYISGRAGLEVAYLVKGRTFSSYYDIKFGKVPAQKFQIVFTSAADEDMAANAARWIYQEEHRQCAIIDSVEKIRTSSPKSDPINWDLPWYQQRLVAFDVETTGFSPLDERIAEIAFSVFNPETKSFDEPCSYFLNDGVPMSDGASAVNGITNEMLEGQPTFAEMLPMFKSKFVTEGTILIAHNRGFDMSFWLNSVARAGDETIISPPCWCSMELAILTPVGQSKNRLVNVAEALGVEGENTHRAGDDAQLAGDVFLALARKNRFFHTATTRDVMNYFDNNPSMEGYERFGF